jgi:hypothetical protein
MGFDSINAFEIKVGDQNMAGRGYITAAGSGWTFIGVSGPPTPQISGGAGEVLISRDLYRLSARFDFFRLLQ